MAEDITKVCVLRDGAKTLSWQRYNRYFTLLDQGILRPDGERPLHIFHLNEGERICICEAT